ncbi:MAG: helix-turn-helix domain-containing protein [Bdellovibrionaceae bacterium]|nr:helix-turn-helix domain-containing protein [Pseudobdellovibrionaceae bacterium]
MITENKNNYYEILEVSTTATQHDILLAYQKAKLTYSASNMAIRSAFSGEELNELKKLVDEAFLVLSNQNYRNIYEQRLNTKSYSESDITFNGIKDFTHDISPTNTVEKLIQKYNSMSHKVELVAIVEAEALSVPVDETFEQEMHGQTEWSGDFLKKVREYKKISIDKLQESTKVNPWYLKALETMDVKNLPATVFVRGYVIQMAKELGLNEKNVADSYMKIYKTKLEHTK